MTAEEAGAYKPDPRPYRAALTALGLAPGEVLFVAGSAHDVGGATRVGMDVYWANRGNAPLPTDATALRVEPDFRGLREVVEADHPAR
jgi:FMN phosphatase YigB (HAD superfamily)